VVDPPLVRGVIFFGIYGPIGLPPPIGGMGLPGWSAVDGAPLVL
jgi:hypothetical protein